MNRGDEDIREILRPYLHQRRARARFHARRTMILRVLVGAMGIVLSIVMVAIVRADQPQTASWYDRASCLKESGQAKMANGKELDDEKLTAASWDYPFGTMVKVTNLDNGKSVIVEISDRGPNKKLYRSGRILDLSKKSFQSIASLKNGTIPISITIIKGR